MRSKSLVLIFIVLCGVSCDKIIDEDDVLTLDRQAFVGNDLALNGYYYTEVETFEGIIFDRYAFYRNGIIRYLGGSESLQEKNFHLNQSKVIWGVFQIDGKNIKFERWYPSSGGPLKAYIRAGDTLNDTTFHITESYRMQDGQKTEVREKNETYHFKEFSPKPDSTNAFIK